MTSSPRRKRKQKRIYAFAGAAVLCAASALAWVLMRDRTPRLVAVSPAALETAGVMATPVPSAEAAAPDAAPEPAPSPTEPPTPARTPFPAPAIRRSVLERSLYQGSLSIGKTQARGRLSLTYVNNGIETLYVIFLHLHPNARAPGSLSIQAVALDGVRAYYTLEGEGALLRLPLVNELRGGEAVRIYLEFSVEIPENGSEAALAADGGFPLSGVFPMAAVYENGWITDATPDRVDYAPLADWRLLMESAREPAFAGGETRRLGEGQYLCAARTAIPQLLLK